MKVLKVIEAQIAKNEGEKRKSWEWLYGEVKKIVDENESYKNEDIMDAAKRIAIKNGLGLD